MRRTMGASAGLLLFGLALAVAPASAQEQEHPAGIEAATTAELTEASADELQPGEYRWNPDAAPAGPISILVSIQRQIDYVYRSGKLIGVTTVSTGKPGHDTPVGTFTVLQKKVYHRSTIYDGAPMPFMRRLTWDGIALHAGRIPGYPASHGCVRLPQAFAKILYGATRLGVEVTIQDEDVITAPLDVAIAEPQPALQDTASGDVQLASYSSGASR